jgi:hypothetical protein
VVSPDLRQIGNARCEIFAPGLHSKSFAVFAIFPLNLLGLQTFGYSTFRGCLDDCVDSKRANCQSQNNASIPDCGRCAVKFVPLDSIPTGFPPIKLRSRRNLG